MPCQQLGHLANPVSTHVQPAEMGNQAINSLALISARRTAEANDVLSLLLATHLYCVLQAVDLRAMEFEHTKAFEPMVTELLKQHFGALATAEVEDKVRKSIYKRLQQNNSYDLEQRWHDTFSVATGAVVEALAGQEVSLASLNAWKVACAEKAIALTRSVRDSFWAAPSSSSPALKYSPRGRASCTRSSGRRSASRPAAAMSTSVSRRSRSAPTSAASTRRSRAVASPPCSSR